MEYSLKGVVNIYVHVNTLITSLPSAETLSSLNSPLRFSNVLKVVFFPSVSVYEAVILFSLHLTNVLSTLQYLSGSKPGSMIKFIVYSL